MGELTAHVVAEVRPYRLIENNDGRCAVVEARCGKVYCLDCDHPRHVASDTPEGMAAVVGVGWMERGHANALFRRMVDGEEHYGEMLW